MLQSKLQWIYLQLILIVHIDISINDIKYFIFFIPRGTQNDSKSMWMRQVEKWVWENVPVVFLLPRFSTVHWIETLDSRQRTMHLGPTVGPQLSFGYILLNKYVMFFMEKQRMKGLLSGASSSFFYVLWCSSYWNYVMGIDGIFLWPMIMFEDSDSRFNFNQFLWSFLCFKLKVSKLVQSFGKKPECIRQK